MHVTRMNLENIFLVKEASHKRHTIGFQSYEMSVTEIYRDR